MVSPEEGISSVLLCARAPWRESARCVLLGKASALVTPRCNSELKFVISLLDLAGTTDTPAGIVINPPGAAGPGLTAFSSVSFAPLELASVKTYVRRPQIHHKNPWRTRHSSASCPVPEADSAVPPSAPGSGRDGTSSPRTIIGRSFRVPSQRQCAVWSFIRAYDRVDDVSARRNCAELGFFVVSLRCS